MHYEFLTVPLFLAFAYRARGGAISLGDRHTNEARLFFWALPVGLVGTALCASLGFPLWLGLFVAVMAFSGSTIGHASFQSPGWGKYLEMGGYTYGLLSLIIMPLALYGYSMNGFPNALIALTGAVFLGAFASWLGYKMKFSLCLFGRTWCVPGDSSWEEFYIGLFAFGLPLGLIGFIGKI